MIRPPETPPFSSVKCASVSSRFMLSLACNAVLTTLMALSFVLTTTIQSIGLRLTCDADWSSRSGDSYLRFVAFLQRLHPCQIDFECYRPLQQGNAEDDPMFPSEVNENAFDATQCSCMNPNPLAYLEIRPRLALDPRSDRDLNRLDLTVIHRHWCASTSDDLQDSGSHHHGAPLRVFKPAKHVARKQ